eukprot:6456494-Amphidinium_carterae.1
MDLCCFQFVIINYFNTPNPGKSKTLNPKSASPASSTKALGWVLMHGQEAIAFTTGKRIDINIRTERP